MRSIPVGICRFFDNNCKRPYLEKERLFFCFLLDIWNVHEIKNILKNKKSVLAYLLTKLLNPKEMFT